MEQSHIALAGLIVTNLYLIYEVRSKKYNSTPENNDNREMFKLFYDDFGLFIWILITTLLHFIFATVIPLTIVYVAINERIGSINIAYLSCAITVLYVCNPLIRHFNPIKVSPATNSSIVLAFQLLQVGYMVYLLLVVLKLVN